MKNVPSIQIRCSNTASFRAKATAAFLWPTRERNARAQAWRCAPLAGFVRVIKAEAASYSSVRMVWSPRLLIRPDESRSPD